jgi:hypothetical protein
MSGHAKRKQRWGELSTEKRAAIGASAVVQLTLLAAALVDLRRRPAKEVRGDKRVWTAVAFVNYIGPIAYFAFGRRR